MQNLDLTDFLGNINLEEYLGLKDGSGTNVQDLTGINRVNSGLEAIGSSFEEFYNSF
jgi:hypothetical protein